MNAAAVHFPAWTRRELLHACGGLGTAGLLALLAKDGLAEGILRRAPRAKRCIFFFMAGGVSQIDLFDPKPKLRELHGQRAPNSAAAGERFAFVQADVSTLLGSPFSFAPSGQCGMQLSELLPAIAAHADRLCLARSVHTEPFNHHPAQTMWHSGFARIGRPTVGSWLSYGLGHERSNLPDYVVLECQRNTRAGPDLWSNGFLPAEHGGLRLALAEKELVPALARPRAIPEAVEQQSLATIAQLNRLRLPLSGDPGIESRIASYELAFRMQSALPELTDLSREPDAVRASYGIERAEDQGRFARACLLARRMVEQGVSFVHVIHTDWDHHTGLSEGLRKNCRAVDQPIGALLSDLAARGLLEETLVVWTSEFGRTPFGENRPGRPEISGRDHQPAAFSLWLAGAGIRPGHVHGATDELGFQIEHSPVSVHDFHATLLHLFGFDHRQLTYAFEGRRYRLTDVAGEVQQGFLA